MGSKVELRLESTASDICSDKVEKRLTTEITHGREQLNWNFTTRVTGKVFLLSISTTTKIHASGVGQRNKDFVEESERKQR